jgi:hypothetical protein
MSVEFRITKDTATPLLQRMQENVMVATRTKLNVGARAPYAKYPEYGTRRMAPRPYLRPAIDANRQELAKAFRDAVLFGDVVSSLNIVGSSIKSLATVLAPVRTGFLRSTIYYEVI